MPLFQRVRSGTVSWCNAACDALPTARLGKGCLFLVPFGTLAWDGKQTRYYRAIGCDNRQAPIFVANGMVDSVQTHAGLIGVTHQVQFGKSCMRGKARKSNMWGYIIDGDINLYDAKIALADGMWRVENKQNLNASILMSMGKVASGVRMLFLHKPRMLLKQTANKWLSCLS